MITAVDTNVLLDVLLGDREFLADSLAALECAASEGHIIMSAVVGSELAAAFPTARAAREYIVAMEVGLTSASLDEVVEAGQAWRNRRGRSRERVLPDYLIASHAAASADRLLTRDAGFSRLTIPGLEVVNPRQLLEGR